MSFDIFFYSYERGQPHSFPLSAAESAFQAAIVSREHTGSGLLWQLEYQFFIHQTFRQWCS